jgi:divalent metal cation (Fe/Co/Zn/Cd) transporter
MTGRASAMAAGHGFLMGWVFAIAGDMLYYAVIAVTTLNLSTYVRDPDLTMGIVLAAMIMVPLIVRAFRRLLHKQGSPAVERGQP